MKQIDKFIVEMSAWHNRKNDSIIKEIEKLQKEMEANNKEDKERILNAAGIKGSKKANEVYDYAMELVRLILSAEKPYGAILFILAHLKECAAKYGEKNSGAKSEAELLDKILVSDAISELIGKDSSFDKIQKQIDKLHEKSSKLKGENDELKNKLDELERKYPDIDYYKNY